MADYKEVVEMLGDNLASFLGITKKFLIDWAIKPKELLHLFHNLAKDDLLGLLNGTHEIKFKPILVLFDNCHKEFMIYEQQRHTPWKEMFNSLTMGNSYEELCVLSIDGKDDYEKAQLEVQKKIKDFCYKNKKVFIVFERYFLLVKYKNDFIASLVRFHLDYRDMEISCVNLTTCVAYASSERHSYVLVPR
jgi:hypothetical protein